MYSSSACQGHLILHLIPRFQHLSSRSNIPSWNLSPSWCWKTPRWSCHQIFLSCLCRLIGIYHVYSRIWFHIHPEAINTNLLQLGTGWGVYKTKFPGNLLPEVAAPGNCSLPQSIQQFWEKKLFLVSNYEFRTLTSECSSSGSWASERLNSTFNYHSAAPWPWGAHNQTACAEHLLKCTQSGHFKFPSILQI